MWVTEQLEASRLKLEEETENEVKSSNPRSTKGEHTKENFINSNLLYNYPLLPKDEYIFILYFVIYKLQNF